MQYTVLIDTKNPAGSSIDLEEFGRLVQDGTILSTTQVWQAEQGRWIEAQSHPDLSSLFTASLWDAWDEAADISLSTPIPQEGMTVEEAQIEPLKEEEVLSFVDVLPSKKEPESTLKDPEEQVVPNEQIQVLEVSDLEIFQEDELPLLDEIRLIPLDEVHRPEEMPLQEEGPPPQVPPLVFTHDIPRRSRPMHIEEPKRFSFVRVAIPIVLGSLVIFGGLDYVRSINEQRYQPPPTPEIVGQSNDPIWTIEDEVRKQVGEDIIPLNPESSFEDILHVELQRNGITSIKIRASVTEWTGRKLDQPKKIDVRLRAESTGELDRDIGTISLIFGKYIEYYFMDVERLEVCVSSDPESYLCTPLNPEVIRRFYLKRIRFDAFFTDVFSVP